MDRLEPVCPACEMSRPGAGWTPDPRLGDRLPDGRILRRRLGFGLTGSVYLADREGGQEPIAVKVLRLDLSGDPELARRFRLEAVLTRSLNLPQVVPAYEWGELPDGAPFFTMEFVDGPGLDRVLAEQGALPVETVLVLARQVLSALDVAHGLGVIHRDLKPANLLMARDAQGRLLVRILDFGFARLLADASVDGPQRRLTRARTVLGTPTYMSPEQARGSLVVDSRSDLYSLGVILYRALAGVAPFTGSQQDVLRHHIETPPHPVTVHRPDVPSELGRILSQMLEKDPDHRPASAGAVLAVLNAAFPGSTGSFDPDQLRAAAAPRAELVRQVERHVLRTRSLPAMADVPQADETSMAATRAAATPAAARSGRRRAWLALAVGLGLLGLGVASWLVLRA